MIEQPASFSIHHSGKCHGCSNESEVLAFCSSCWEAAPEELRSAWAAQPAWPWDMALTFAFTFAAARLNESKLESTFCPAYAKIGYVRTKIARPSRVSPTALSGSAEDMLTALGL